MELGPYQKLTNSIHAAHCLLFDPALFSHHTAVPICTIWNTSAVFSPVGNSQPTRSNAVVRTRTVPVYREFKLQETHEKISVGRNFNLQLRCCPVYATVTHAAEHSDT